MKKLLAILLTIIMVSAVVISCAAPAPVVTPAPAPSEPVVVTPQPAPDPTKDPLDAEHTVEGVITDLSDDHLVLTIGKETSLTFGVGPDTQILGTTALKIGNIVDVDYAGEISEMAEADVVKFVSEGSPSEAKTIIGKVIGTTDNAVVANCANGHTYSFAVNNKTELGGVDSLAAGVTASIEYAGDLDNSPVALKVDVTKKKPAAPSEYNYASGTVSSFNDDSVTIVTESGHKYTFALLNNTKIHGKANSLDNKDKVKIKYKGAISAKPQAVDINITVAYVPPGPAPSRTPTPTPQPSGQPSSNTIYGRLTTYNYGASTFRFATDDGGVFTVGYDNRTSFRDINGGTNIGNNATIKLIYTGGLSAGTAYAVSVTEAAPGPLPTPVPTPRPTNPTRRSIYGVLTTYNYGASTFELDADNGGSYTIDYDGSTNFTDSEGGSAVGHGAAVKVVYIGSLGDGTAYAVSVTETMPGPVPKPTPTPDPDPPFDQ